MLELVLTASCFAEAFAASGAAVFTGSATVGPRSGSASGAHEVAQGEVSEEQSESRNKDHASRPYFPCRITAVLADAGECAKRRERQKEYTCNLMPESRKNVRERVKDGSSRLGRWPAASDCYSPSRQPFGRQHGQRRHFCGLQTFPAQLVIVTSLQELNRSRIRRIQRIGYAVSPGNHLAAQTPGGEVNPKLKHLMKELGEAINDSLSESEEIAEVISKIKAGGYDVFLVLEATIGFNKQEQEEAATESADGVRTMLISKSPVRT